MDNENEVIDANDLEGDGEDTAAAAPEPKIDPKQIARELLTEMQSQQPTTPAKQEAQRSRLEAEVERLVESGLRRDAIQNLLTILQAHTEDMQDNYRKKSEQDGYQRFMGSLWAKAEDAIKEYDGKVPGLSTSMHGLVLKVSDMIGSDKDFDSARQAIKSGRMPDKKTWEKAAERVIDEHLKDLGVAKPKQPMTIKNSKPDSPTASKPQGNFVEGLDMTQRKLYRAIMNGCNGDEKMAQRLFKQSAAALSGR